jgi:hypothetical protein
MTVLFYMALVLGLAIVKTSLIPSLYLFKNFYDLLIPIVICVSFFRTVWEGIPIVLFCGFVMDSLGGGPVGLYTITYLWLYAAGHWAAGFLFTSSIAVLAAAVALGVIFEIVILLSYIALLSPITGIPVGASRTAATQIVWALFTGPILIFMIGVIQKRIDRWRVKLFANR